ncbi:hypothetical protein QBC40DRAFT_171051 [Triangularia verruculosa]|uniref:Uncharacterized protein n=1 Tax=Triangularia verruculosa TaxID=2587418 RepID=A0AAN7AW45_9PEZI|nr:hypothetical protein QBC40DRAFT_171051 [Triangularia verruculosa]
MDVDIAVTTDDKEFVKEEQLSVKQSKKKKDAGTAGKKKKKGVSAGKGERLLTGREMMEIFPDLPKPAPDGEDEEGKENCTGDDPPSSSSPFQSTHFDSSATTARMEIGFDEAEADDEGGEKEEIRGLIEEIFERPGFLFRGGEEEKEKVHRGEKVGGEMEMGSRDTNAPAAGKHDNAGGDLAAIKTLLQALESKMDAPCSNDGKGQQDELKDLTKELREVFNGMVKLSGRVHRDEMRAGIRHEILFDGMKKVVGELAVVKRQGEAVVEHLGLRTVSPKERRKWEEKDQNKEGRKALESCLKFHLEDMGRAREKGQLEEKGRLAVEYAGKVLGGV